MLERGSHVPPSDFTENEAEQLSKLYANGALNFSTDFNFRVVQGMCVGGSTVVNNAVCFDLPPHVLERWNDEDGLNAGLDASEAAARLPPCARLHAGCDGRPSRGAQPGGVPDHRGAEAHRVRSRSSSSSATSPDCLGSGYCNIGCAYGKKLSALDWTLPRAQLEFGDAVRVLPDCRVEKVLVRDKRAYGVRARLEDGRRLTVRANTIVLSAGTIASSLILQRSGLGGELAGRGLSFNMGSPVTFDFAEVLHSERGMQISHFMRPTDGADDGARLRDVVQPDRRAVALHARLVRGALGQHAPLQAHDVPRHGGRDGEQRQRQGQQAARRREARLHARPIATSCG